MKKTDEVKCPKCGADVAMRINRNGFMQKHVLVRFGIYPWKCGACGSAFLFRKRGTHHRRSSGHARPGGSDPNRTQAEREN